MESLRVIVCNNVTGNSWQLLIGACGSLWPQHVQVNNHKTSPVCSHRLTISSEWLEAQSLAMVHHLCTPYLNWWQLQRMVSDWGRTPWFECLIIFDFFTPSYRGSREASSAKIAKDIQRKTWSNAPSKLLACIGFLYKVVHKIGRLRKFNRARKIEFNLLTAWTITMKLGTLVHRVPGYRFLIFTLGHIELPQRTFRNGR